MPESMLSQFFSSAEGEGKIALFMLPSKETLFFGRARDAMTKAKKLSSSQDVYFALGLQPKSQRGVRAPAKKVLGIPGLWCDLDTTSTAGKGRFVNVGDIAEWLRTEIPIAPSHVVGSGSGVHAYWVFEEFMLFDDEEERASAARMLRGWQAQLQHSAPDGISLDATHDLARVLRVPGTVNRKGTAPAPVKVLWERGARFNPSDFETFAPQDPSIYKPKIDDIHESRGMAEATEALLEGWRELRPVNELTWLMKRPGSGDSALADRSPSGYMMSLAHGLARDTGLSDQEITDALYAWRDLHNLDRSHTTKYRKTVERAREWVEAENPKAGIARAERALLNGSADPDELEEETHVPGDPQENARIEFVRVVRTATDLPIQRIQRFRDNLAGEARDEYVAMLDDGSRITLGSRRLISKLVDFKYAMLRDGVVPRFRCAQKDWPPVVEALVRGAEDVAPEEVDGTDAEALASLLLDSAVHVKWDRGAGAHVIREQLSRSTGCFYLTDTGELWFRRNALRDAVQDVYGRGAPTTARLVEIIRGLATQKRWKRQPDTENERRKLPETRLFVIAPKVVTGLLESAEEGVTHAPA